MPGINPVTVVEAEEGVAIEGVPGPETKVHVPTPLTGVLAARETTVARHKPWSGPALAIVPPVTTIIFTVEELTQVPLVIVHLKL